MPTIAGRGVRLIRRSSPMETGPRLGGHDDCRVDLVSEAERGKDCRPRGPATHTAPKMTEYIKTPLVSDKINLEVLSGGISLFIKTTDGNGDAAAPRIMYVDADREALKAVLAAWVDLVPALGAVRLTPSGPPNP